MSPPRFKSSGEEPLIKKKKPSPELPQPPQSTQITSLPGDLLLSCFARISRSRYPALSFVSKRFRSLLSSPELYKTRSLLGFTENVLYVCLQLSPHPNHRWFTLCRNPNRKEEEEKSSCNLFVPISVPNPPRVCWPQCVTVGSSLYAIGGPNHSPSSDVWVLDSHCLVWRKAPNMRVERSYPAANAYDGKIYVAGGCRERNSTDWMEVFDPKTQTWEPVLCPLKRLSTHVSTSVVIEGRICYMFGNKTVAYKPKEDRWEDVRKLHLDFGRGRQLICCVVDNVLCRLSTTYGLQWFDFERRCWMNLKGLEGLPKFSVFDCVCGILAEYGGKLAFLWTNCRPLSCNEDTRVSCAVIVLERRDNDEIWGTVEWVDHVLTVPNSYKLECVLAATV